jgi:hypothetical protein
VVQTQEKNYEGGLQLNNYGLRVSASGGFRPTPP